MLLMAPLEYVEPKDTARSLVRGVGGLEHWLRHSLVHVSER